MKTKILKKSVAFVVDLLMTVNLFSQTVVQAGGTFNILPNTNQNQTVLVVNGGTIALHAPSGSDHQWMYGETGDMFFTQDISTVGPGTYALIYTDGNSATWALNIYVHYQVQGPGCVTITPPATSIQVNFSSNFELYTYYSFNTSSGLYDILYGGGANNYFSFTQGSYLLKFRDVAQFWSYDTLTVSGLSAVVDAIAFEAITICPTLTSGLCTIKGVEHAKFAIYSTTGRLVTTGNGNEIDLSGYNAGIYFIKISSRNTNVSTVKVMKR